MMGLEQEARDMGSSYRSEGIEPTQESVDEDWREAKLVHGLRDEQKPEFVRRLLRAAGYDTAPWLESAMFQLATRPEAEPSRIGAYIVGGLGLAAVAAAAYFAMTSKPTGTPGTPPHAAPPGGLPKAPAPPIAPAPAPRANVPAYQAPVASSPAQAPLPAHVIAPAPAPTSAPNQAPAPVVPRLAPSGPSLPPGTVASVDPTTNTPWVTTNKPNEYTATTETPPPSLTDRLGEAVASVFGGGSEGDTTTAGGPAWAPNHFGAGAISAAQRPTNFAGIVAASIPESLEQQIHNEYQQGFVAGKAWLNTHASDANLVNIKLDHGEFPVHAPEGASPDAWQAWKNGWVAGWRSPEFWQPAASAGRVI